MSDGSSDRCLLYVLRWLLISNGVARAIQGSWADLGRLRNVPKQLGEKISLALQFYPCDLLLIHRDAETKQPTDRRREIAKAVRQASAVMGQLPPAICVVPVRMSEAWFLFDDTAIRHAAGNPGGRKPLALPRIGQIETLPDPKDRLYDLIKQASGLNGRRLQRFNAAAAVLRLASIIDDYGALRALPAFRALEDELRAVVGNNRWNTRD